ncbi:MAG: DUF721 domain-containing protein [Ignavibacteriales bacterium]|nr:DUF721 domain-containing protein [Ignavibacteriales bacterium]
MKNALAELVQNLGIGKKLREYDAVTRWEEVVGEQIAKVTKATRIDKGVLVIKVKNSPWRNELTLRKGEIIRKINGSLGSNIVNDIRFV